MEGQDPKIRVFGCSVTELHLQAHLGSSPNV
jgi:hypothetical protein